MKKIIFFTLFIFGFIVQGAAQSNMVDNPGFEIIDPSFGCTAASPKYLTTLDYWLKVWPWTVPHKKDICFSEGVGSSDCECNSGHNSMHHGTCMYFEYIVAPLNTQMSEGHSYYVEFYTKNAADAGTDAGLRLFEERPEQCGFHPITHDGEPQVEIPNWIDVSSWTKVSATILADHPYSWLGLGNFKTAGIRNGRMYWFDDITIMDVGSEKCPLGNYVQNVRLDNIGLITYQSQNLTIAGNNVTPGFPVGDVVIGSKGIVDFKSNLEVDLMPGFSTEPGAIFSAYIGPCDARCYPLTVDAGADKVSCSSQTLQIGTAPAFSQNYTWTASPASALAYLSSSTIANPVFTPPATGFGTIKYTVTATNECGAVGSDDMVISYEHTVNNTPTVSVSNVVYSDYIEFDATFGAQTKDFIVEVRNTSGTLINTYNYTVGNDFNCCSFHWKIPEGLSVCADYQLKVYTRNICSSVLSTPAIINWNRNRTTSFNIQGSNVFTPNGDGINDDWCVDITGAVSYTIEIFNRSGVKVYAGGDVLYPPSACMWSGDCNQSACSKSTCPSGAYYFVVKLMDCDGTEHSYSGGLELFRSSKPADNTEIPTNVTEAKSGLDFIISPNPNKGTFSIQLSFVQDENTKVTVYDMLGNEIESQMMKNGKLELDITSHATGMYFVKIENKQFTKMEKIIYQ